MASLEVFLVTPERELWSGSATMVIAHGVDGDVGILAGHAPMLIRLAPSVLRIQHDGDEEKAAVDGGFLHVTTDGEATRVDVLASHAVLAGDVDAGAEQQRKAELEALLQSDKDNDSAKQELQKVVRRLELI
jgi:F-type H+-transporting ATPase subunit epsilon